MSQEDPLQDIKDVVIGKRSPSSDEERDAARALGELIQKGFRVGEFAPHSLFPEDFLGHLTTIQDGEWPGWVQEVTLYGWGREPELADRVIVVRLRGSWVIFGMVQEDWEYMPENGEGGNGG